MSLIHNQDPGLMPGMESLMNGDIGRKRAMLTEVHPVANLLLALYFNAILS